MSPAGVNLNGNLANPYLPNCHAKVVRYENFCLISGCGILNWHLFVSFGNILLTVGPLCTDLISAWLSLAGA